MNDSIIFILKEMCARVGADFDSINFQEESDWYNKYEWTIQECKQFEKWLSDYLYTNTKARNEVMAFPMKRRKSTDRLANEFVFMYGWRYHKD